MIDEDALIAAVDLVARCNASEFEVGYLDDDVPTDQARWWAKAQWRGVRVTVEDHASPVEAAEALARRLLDGGKCAHCARPIVLARRPGRGRVCHWVRKGQKWIRGCRATIPTGQRRIAQPAHGTFPQP